MHTNDMLTGRCLCLYVELETVFTFGHLTKPGACRSTIEDRSPTTSDRVSFSDLVEVVVQWSICMLMKEDTKMSLFQPNCRIENCTPRSFSATTSQSRPLNACHYTTQQALSVHLCSIVSTPSLPYLDEKSKNRLNSRMHGETRLNSCVCEMYECRYSTDNNSAQRACFLKSIERVKGP